MASIEKLLFVLLSAWLPISALEFQVSGGDNLIGNAGDGIPVITGSLGVDEMVMTQQEEVKEDISTRSKRAADYEVQGVSARQDGETRIVKWLHATGPIVVAHYNIYRTFTTAVPFDVTKLTPIASVNRSQPTQWRDDCRIEEASVQYAMTAVDVTGTEHTSNVVPSPILPLVASFVPSTPIKYPLPSLGDCCVLCHDLVYNPDRNEFLFVYDCDNDGDGIGDDVFAALLDYSGENIQPVRSIKATVPGSSTQGCPSAAYNPQYQQYLVAYHIRTTIVNANKQSIVTRVIPARNILGISSPRVTAKGFSQNGRPLDLNRATVIYNPVTYGYVMALEMGDPGSIQVVSSFLSHDGQQKSGGAVFSFAVDVLQPNVIYDPLTKAAVFVSQLDSSHAALPQGKNGLIMKSIPVSGAFSRNGQASLIAQTPVKQSSISLHRDNGTKCIRFCFTEENDNGLTEPTCSKLCNDGFGRWNPSHHDVPFCTCKEKVANPIVIEYPVNGEVFGVWEEIGGTSHRLHGYFVSTQHFVQNPVSNVQKHPTAVYRSSDGQVCVAWQHYSSASTCSKLAFRCYKLSQTCSDSCCCQSSQIDHCNACGHAMCDSNADCTPERQCRCRSALGFSGNGFSCSYDPCAPGSQTCKANENCISNGMSFSCVCKTGSKRVGDSCVVSDPCASGAHDCDVNAFCSRRDDQSYTCHCYKGYVGNGRVCIDTSQCHRDATSDGGKCVCNRGFVGNGAFCCPTNFGDQLVTIGASIILKFDAACLGLHSNFATLQWFHKDSTAPINVSAGSRYTLRESDTELVIADITAKQLGQYTLRFHVDTYGPYVVTARVDLSPKKGKCGCGHSGRVSARISTGGKETKPGEFPWQVMLCGRNGTFCGGVMISKCCILTAAHCVSGGLASSQFDTSRSRSLKVCLGRRCGDCDVGVFKDRKERMNERVQCFRPESIHVHQSFDESSLEHDIAMIQLKRSNCIKCRAASVRPVCLPQASRDSAYIAPGKKAWVTGWGEIQQRNGLSSCLRKGRTALIGHGKCKSFYAQRDRPLAVTNDQMCAEDDVGPCQGDSGGPMVVKNVDFENRFVLAGLVSWGVGCGVHSSYGVYTDILHHLDWIYKTCRDWNQDGK